MTKLHPTLAYHLSASLGWKQLRPLQEQTLRRLGADSDALLVAPTAGGKTEAALFPVLTAMEDQGWTGLSVLYVCPLKALLNNLEPRIRQYADWLGRTIGVWHGDVSANRRQAILRRPPDILLTTPESLESILISTGVDHRRLMADVRAVIVDEVHAFAKDDRGWHLVCVLERIAHLAGRPVQRIGLSATVGDPSGLVSWLQGATERPAEVIAPPAEAGGAPETELDRVGTLANAAKVIASLHRGQKRLVFCDSRRTVEELGEALRGLGVTVFLSHASLSADERRRAEEAFAESGDCVIVSTSTLELGIDVGDLDRVVQINAPWTVSSFLQRLGRTGRRPGKVRNCLFLTLTEEDLLLAAGLLHLWSTGHVEPALPPPDPRHIVAQQLMALALQEGAIGDVDWADWWNGHRLFRPGDAGPVLAHLLSAGYLSRDGHRLFIGAKAEEDFGRRHFMDLMASFTAPPEFTVLRAGKEIGRCDPMVLTRAVHGPRLVLLAGRSWQVDWIDWKRRRCHVVPVTGTGGVARWSTSSSFGISFELARAVRDVVLGQDPPVGLTHRASAALAAARAELGEVAHPDRTMAVRSGDEVLWWTWAGTRVNATLKASLGALADPSARPDDLYIRLRGDLDAKTWSEAAGSVTHLVGPEVDPQAVRGLKFSAALPPGLATATLAARLADLPNAQRVLDEPRSFQHGRPRPRSLLGGPGDTTRL
ncbi:DEAD/DEAH box helicase [Spirillospora sp. NPDC029432]|uniref:DEAD/DEAH box helicase n=1 Tax=Spirillospora sp. NPDC029432 TaxID=3154599 RepID=UPI00345694EC